MKDGPSSFRGILMRGSAQRGEDLKGTEPGTVCVTLGLRGGGGSDHGDTQVAGFWAGPGSPGAGGGGSGARPVSLCPGALWLIQVSPEQQRNFGVRQLYLKNKVNEKLDFISRSCVFSFSGTAAWGF